MKELTIWDEFEGLFFSLGTPGDLTHAKFADERRSQQFEEEWEAYGHILMETGVTERQPWLSIKGNHGELSLSLSLPPSLPPSLSLPLLSS